MSSFIHISEQKVQRLRMTSRIVQGFLYIGASFFHFVNDVELQIIPPSWPLRRTALYITGICEFLGGLGLLIPRFRRSASWGLAVLLVAIWPANIYHAIVDKQAKLWEKRRIYHFARQPLQLVLIAWALWSTNEKKVR